MKALDDHEADAFTVGELLQAANVSLDTVSDGKFGQKDSMRFRGMQLMIKIEYHNHVSFGQRLYHRVTDIPSPLPSYYVTVRRIPFTEYKITEVHYKRDNSNGEFAIDLDAEQRVLVSRFGIKLHFIQTGSISRFSANSLIMEIVAGLTMLGSAQLIVDLVAFYVHPQKESFEEIAFEGVEWHEEQGQFIQSWRSAQSPTTKTQTMAPSSQEHEHAD